MSLRLMLAAVVVGSGVFAAEARAQHVLTDTEAGKLTFDALTAEPVYRPIYRPQYRPIYRQIMAVRRVHRFGSISRRMHASWKAAHVYSVGVHSSRR